MSDPGLETILEDLRDRQPQVVRLAEAVSLAVRVEPALLRSARLEERPRMGVAVEADLAFSSLVETLTVDWLILAPDFIDTLRSSLVQQEKRLHAARERILEAHKYSPATVRLEEDILWYTYAQPEDPHQGIEEALSRVLGGLRADPRENRYMARWFAGRGRYLPPVARDTENFSYLVFLVSALLDGRWIERPTRLDATLVSKLAGLLPELPSVTLWASLSDEGLEIGPDQRADSIEIEVPRTNPLVMTVVSTKGQEVVLLEPRESTIVSGVGGTVRILTAAGQGYRLRQRRRQVQKLQYRIVERPGGPLEFESPRIMIHQNFKAHLVYQYDEPETRHMSAAIPSNLVQSFHLDQGDLIY